MKLNLLDHSYGFRVRFFRARRRWSCPCGSGIKIDLGIDGCRLCPHRRTF